MQDAKSFKFTEFDQFGKPIKISGPIVFSSDNPAAATVDSAKQVENADFSVDVPVVSVGSGQAEISGSDPASKNKVAASDTDIVSPPVATTASGVLS